MTNLRLLSISRMLTEGQHLPFSTQGYILAENVISLIVNLAAGMQNSYMLVVWLTSLLHNLVVPEQQCVNDEAYLERNLQKIWCRHCEACTRCPWPFGWSSRVTRHGWRILILALMFKRQLTFGGSAAPFFRNRSMSWRKITKSSHPHFESILSPCNITSMHTDFYYHGISAEGLHGYIWGLPSRPPTERVYVLSIEILCVTVDWKIFGAIGHDWVEKPSAYFDRTAVSPHTKTII